MLETIAILLILLWALGMLSSYTLGGIVHVLLVIALVVVLLRLIRGGRVA
ncbi:MAG: lmo0937 family membrane protein [Planctomycetes bacterium]|nr:lmo0937 family membrane protein [Planctomycetota bacterium]